MDSIDDIIKRIRVQFPDMADDDVSDLAKMEHFIDVQLANLALAGLALLDKYRVVFLLDQPTALQRDLIVQRYHKEAPSWKSCYWEERDVDAKLLQAAGLVFNTNQPAIKRWVFVLVPDPAVRGRVH